MTERDVFVAALDRPDPGDRAAFLDRACGGDADLRGRVEDLLREHDRAGSFLERPPAGPAAGDPGPVAGVLGDFRIVREVGRGGMGVVYEAEQVTLGRRVALKVLPFAAVLDDRRLRRFVNEARAAATLDHPHVVKVHAVGQDRGVHYIAMQFVDGGTLAELVAELRADAVGGGGPTAAYGSPGADPAGPTAAVAAAPTARSRPDRGHHRRAAEWVAQAADALEHAHALGVVHRDVKPANLLVDRSGRLLVADFGLAQVAADPGLTGTGDVLGTPRYMAPEQAAARHGLVDHRADVYALGATLYELLTLRPAAAGADRDEVLRGVLADDPVPPRRVDRSVPADLETIVLKALRKDPVDRYQTARELADDLRRFLADEPIRARRPGWGRVAAKWARRNRVLVGAAGAVLLAAVAALATSTALIWQAKGRAQANYEAAEAQRRRAERHFRAAREAVDQMLTEVGQDRLKNVPMMTEVRRNLLQKALAFSRTFLDEEGDDPAVRHEVGRAYLRVGEIQYLLAQQKEAADAYHRGVVLLEGLAADFPGEPAYRDDLGRGYRGVMLSSGSYTDAERAYRRAVEVQDRLAADSPGTASHRLALADTHLGWGHLLNNIPGRHRAPEADRALRTAQEILEGLVGLDPAEQYRKQLGRVLGNRTDVLLAMGNLDEAKRAADRALDVRSGLAAEFPRNPDHRGYLGDAYWNVAKVDHTAVRLPEAAAGYSRSADQWRTLVEDFPGIPAYRLRLCNALAGLAQASQVLGRTGEAEAAIREAIRVGETANYHSILGEVLVEKRDYDGAAASLRRAIELAPDNPIYHHNLGSVHACQGRLDEAATEFRKALRLRNDFPEARANLATVVRVEAVAKKLPDILKGDARPADAAERLAVANLCDLPFQKRYATAARFYRDAFDADPKLADDLTARHRYAAASAAALAGRGEGLDAGALSAAERSRLRRQALVWLHDDLAGWRRRLGADPAKARVAVSQCMQRWLRDPDFAGVREPDALARLPEDERADWQRLWQEVEALRQQAAGRP